MNYEVFTQELSSINLEIIKVVNTINPHSYVTAKNDKEFTTTLKESDILIPHRSGPKRLWRRNLMSTPLFLSDIFLFKFRLKK